MSKFATKAAANMFCQARYEAAKSNERLSSREGAAEEIGIDRTRLARIELGSTIPYQEEVLRRGQGFRGFWGRSRVSFDDFHLLSYRIAPAATV